jgi:hypothetical protein
MQEFQVLRVIGPALRMKAQVDSNNRGQKELEKRRERLHERTCRVYQKLVVPWVGLRIGFYSLFEYCLRADMSLRYRQTFPGKKRYFLDHFSPFRTSCSPSFISFLKFYIFINLLYILYS